MGLLQYFALKETFPITRRANTNVGTWISLRLTISYLRFSIKDTLVTIRKTCLYNFYPLKPRFYIVKLGFTRVYIILLISAQNIDCGTR